MGSNIVLRKLLGDATIVITGNTGEVIHTQPVRGRLSAGSEYKIKIDIEYDDIRSWYAEAHTPVFEINYTVERAK